MGRRKPRRDTDNETPPKDTQTKQSSENPSTSKEEKKTSERSPEPGDSGSKSPATSMTFSSPRKSLTPPSFKLFETSRTSSTVSRTTTEEQSGSCSESYHHLGHSRATSLKDGLKKAKNIATGFVKQLRARSKSPRPEDRKAYIFAPKSCALKDEEMKETFASIYDHFRLSRKPKEGKAEDTRPPSDAEDREKEKEEVEVEEDSSAERAVVGDSGLSASSTSTDPMARLTPDSVRMRHSSKSPSKGSQKTPESHPEHDTSEVGAVHRPRKGAEETFQSPRKSTDEDSISSLTSSTPAMPLTDAEETIPEQASDSKQGEEVTEDSKPSQAPSQETIQPKRPATLAPQSSRFIEDSEQPSCSNWRSAVELNEYTFPSAVPSQSTSSTPSSETMDAIARMYEEYLEDVNCPLRNDRDEIIQLMQNFLAGKFPHEAVREGARWFCVGNYSIWMGIQDSCADYWFHCGLVRKKKNEGKPKKPKDYGKHLICCRAHSLEPGKTDSAPAERRSADKSKVDSLGSSELDGSETSDKNLNESAKTKASRAKPPKPEESETSSEKPSRPEGSSSSLETSWQTQSGESAPSAREQMSDFVQKFLAGEERPPLQPRVAYSFFYP